VTGMAEFLVFTLAGPFASFGEVAGNERRGSRDRPGHSMLTGLLAAAVGIRRDEADRLHALSEACRFSVRTDRSGTLLVDYHTVQSAKRRRNFSPATRKEMLETGDRTTIITRREYLQDVRFTVATAIVDGGPHRLEDLRAAIERPHFALYIGRRSCPPSLPLMPTVVAADEPNDAFSAYDALHGANVDRFWPAGHRRRQPHDTTSIAVDARLLTDRQPDGRIERRRTRPVDRGTWRFDTLDELVLAPRPTGTDGEPE